MREASQFEKANLPLSQVGQIDAVCLRFEAAWRAGERPRIVDYLGNSSGPERSRLLRELVALDIDYRRQAGEKPQLAEYCAQFASLDPTHLQDSIQTLAEPSVRSSPPPVVKPPEIPGYEILGELGRGGMGVVYQAWQTGLHRLVALKMVLAGAHAGANERARFRTEAEAVARLQHPHIVQIYEVGQHQQHPYIALEYVDSGSLARKLDGTPLPARQAAQWVATLARAVHYAHQRGIVHRDLTPGNVLLAAAEAPDGLPLAGGAEAGPAEHYVPKLTDFGLAKLLIGGGPTLTQSGAFLGTPSYTAPEQAAGRMREVGPAADIYALGAILYELLTGRPPFKAESALETLVHVQSQEPVSPSRLQPKVPRDLTTICLKCLEKEPGKRYASAEALAEDLHRFLAGEPIRARPVGNTERLLRWCRRNPALATMAGLAVLLLAAVALVSAMSAIRLKGERDRAEEAERQGRLELGKSLLAQGTADQRTGLAGQRFDSLDLLGRAALVLRSHAQGEAHLPEVRDQVITALGLTDLRALAPRSIGAVMSTWCDDRLERYAVFEFRSGELVVRRMDDDRELLRLPRPGIPFWFAHAKFSPDGRYLAAVYRATRGAEDLLRVWRLENKEPVFSQAVQRTTGWAFHVDGRRLLFSPRGGGLGIWDLEAGREVKRLPLDLAPEAPCVASDGQRVAVNNSADSGRPPLVKLLDLETGQELASWNSQVGTNAMAWSADGRLLVTGCSDDGRVYVWDVPRGQLASVLQGHTGRVTNCQFARAGHLLATSSWDGTTRLWDAASGEALATAPGTLVSEFSADDRRLVFYDNAELGVWEVAHGRECRTLHPGMIGNRTEPSGASGQVQGADFSSHGRLLAVADGDGVRLYATDTGKELAHLRVGSCDTVLFHPDGQSLITYSQRGLYRWPIQYDMEAGTDVRWIGPPQLLRASGPLGPYKAAWLPGCGALAAIDNNRARVVLINLPHHSPAPQPNPPPAVEGEKGGELRSEHHRMRSIAVSPDGRWAAAGGWKERGIQVWDLPERRLERVLAPSDGAGEQMFAAGFSPDGPWLVSRTNNDEAGGYYFWRVGTWERGLVIRCPDLAALLVPPAFTRDGRLMALCVSPQQIRLADAATGRAIAHLSTLQRLAATPLAFSADGTRLAAATNQRTVLLWDLRAIRQELAERGLDWNQPPYESVTEGKSTPPLEVQVDLGTAFELLPGGDRTSIGLNSFLLALNPFNFEAYWHRGDAHARLRETQKAVDDYSMALAWIPPGHSHRATVLQARARLFQRLGDFARERADLEQVVELDPEQAEACNNLAWLYLTGPEQQRDLPRALTLAKKAVALTPDTWEYLNTLGVAYYRQRQYEQAIETLERSLRESKEEFAAYDLFFLAMSHAQRGESAEAKRCFERAVRWVQERQGNLQVQAKEELDAIRAEAEALLPQPAKH